MISKKAAWKSQAAFFVRGKSNKNKIDEDPEIRYNRKENKKIYKRNQNIIQIKLRNGRRK